MAPRVVALGGGHGLARALRALRVLDLEPTAVVTVADDGGSSGRLRRDLGIIAPGDLRQALVTLARNDALAALLAHRFGRGELEGHAVGNLALVALAERNDEDFVAALDEAAALLDCAGRVLPTTTEPVRLMAKVGGREINGQVEVMTAQGSVERVWLDPDGPGACPPAVAAIAEADAVILGPGSLFTSVIAAALVPEIGRALATTSARTVYVANLLTQPGETSDMDGQAHVDALLDHVPGLVLDAVVVHDGPRPTGPGELLGSVITSERVQAVVAADVLDRSTAGGHDPARLAAVLSPLVDVRAAPR